MLFLAAGSLLLWHSKNEYEIEEPAMLRPIMAFLAVAVMSSFFSVDWRVSLLGQYRQPYDGFLIYAICFLLYLAGPNVGLLPAIAWASLPLSVYAVVQALDGGMVFGRAFSFIGNPVHFGACYAVILPVCFRMACGIAPDKYRTLGIVAASLSGLGLAVCGARGAWISAFAGVWGYAWLSFEAERRDLAILALAGILVGFGAIALGGQSDSMRWEIWRTAWLAGWEHPWWGSGPGTFLLMFRKLRSEEFIRITQSSSMAEAFADNDILHVWATMGLAGILAYGYLLWAAAKRIQAYVFSEGPVVGAVLFAVFIQAKVNAIPIPVLALTAMMISLLPAEGALSPWVKTAAKWCSGAILAVMIVLCIADFRFKQGMNQRRPEEAFSHHLVAATLDPWNIEYRSMAVDNAITLGALSKKNRMLFMRKALKLAEPAVRHHPNDPHAHFMLGTAELVQGNPPTELEAKKAFTEFQKAQHLDPKFSLLLEHRAKFAYLLRYDRGMRIRKEWERILSLMGDR